MHAKVVVADDTTFVGSFNFSRSGERNAENVSIRDAAVADRMASYVDKVRARYPEPRFQTSRWRRPAIVGAPRILRLSRVRTECLPARHKSLKERQRLGV